MVTDSRGKSLSVGDVVAIPVTQSTGHKADYAAIATIGVHKQIGQRMSHPLTFVGRKLTRMSHTVLKLEQ